MLSPTPRRKAAVLLLLAIAGCVDAVGLAELGRFFAASMSGNLTTLGLLLAGRDWAGALVPLGLAALFVGGGAAGALVVEGAGARGRPVLLLLQGALVLAAWLFFRTPTPMLGVVLLPVAAGAGAPVAIADGLFPTAILARLGVALAGLGRGTRTAEAGWLAAGVLALALGALGGAWGRLLYGSAVLLAPAAALLLVGGAGLVGERRPR